MQGALEKSGSFVASQFKTLKETRSGLVGPTVTIIAPDRG
jgi:hypothetical protein